MAELAATDAADDALVATVEQATDEANRTDPLLEAGEDDDEVTEFERLSQKHADAKRLREERAERDRLAKEHGLAPDDRLITQAIEEARALDET